jgi:muconolactone delta-isomerase
MLFMIRFDIHQPTDMSMKELVDIWNDEAKAALGAVEAGVIKGIWKVSGQRTIFALAEFESHRQVDQVLTSLPIVQAMGGSVDTEAMAVYEYAEFAEDLKAAAEG